MGLPVNTPAWQSNYDNGVFTAVQSMNVLDAQDCYQVVLLQVFAMWYQYGTYGVPQHNPTQHLVGQNCVTREWCHYQLYHF